MHAAAHVVLPRIPRSATSTWRILGIDTIRRILAGQSVNAVIGGVFSLASLGVMLIYDARAGAVRRRLRHRRRRASVRASAAPRCGCSAVVYTRKGIVIGPADRAAGRHRQAARRRRRAARLRALVDAFADQRATTAGRAARDALQAVAATEPADPSAPSASSASPPAATARSMSPPSPPSTAPSASSPRPDRLRQRAQRLDRGRAAVRPPAARARCAARGRASTAPIPARSAGASPCATCRSAMPTTDRGRSRASTSRCGRARASPSSAPRARASRRCCACCSGFETPTRGSVSYDGKDLETLDLGWCAARSAPCSKARRLLPGSLYENIAGTPRCRATRSWKRPGWPASRPTSPACRWGSTRS